MREIVCPLCQTLQTFPGHTPGETECPVCRKRFVLDELSEHSPDEVLGAYPAETGRDERNDIQGWEEDETDEDF